MRGDLTRIARALTRQDSRPVVFFNGGFCSLGTVAERSGRRQSGLTEVRFSLFLCAEGAESGFTPV